MSELKDLPNIGKELEKLLNKVDIKSAEALRQVGSKNAFIQLKTIYPSACISKLCALEGAVQGIRWHNLSSERKQELKEFLKMIEKANEKS
jgi:DNA transformation protein